MMDSMRTPKKPLGPFLMAARSIAHKPLYVSGYNMETKTSKYTHIFPRFSYFLIMLISFQVVIFV